MKDNAHVSRSSVSTKPFLIKCFLQFVFSIPNLFLTRLTPAYLFVLLMAGINMRWLRNMSVFEPLSQDQYNCDVYWWRNVFYINSLFPMKDMVSYLYQERVWVLHVVDESTAGLVNTSLTEIYLKQSAQNLLNGRTRGIKTAAFLTPNRGGWWKGEIYWFDFMIIQTSPNLS